MRHTMGLFIDQSQIDEACVAFRARFPEIMFEGLIILPGALELIKALHQAGIPQGILTNKHGPTARTVSAHCGFDQYIPVCIGNTDTEWNKPQAELTHFAREQIGAEIEGTLYIGDSPTDASTALNAHLTAYGVSTGAHSCAELKQAGATEAFNSLEDLIRFWKL